MTEEVWSQEPWQALLAYHASLQKVVRSWQTFVDTSFAPPYYLKEDMVEWISRLEHTLDVLLYSHVYDTKRTLRIHSAGSGLPERLHLRILETQLEQAKTSGHDVASLKRAYLDHLFSVGHSNHWLLERTAKAQANSLLLDQKPLSLFAVRRLQKVERGGGQSHYVCCFERYCYRNLPSLYVIVFESTEANLDETLVGELLAVLREETAHLLRLGQLARHVDQAIAPIHPKWIGRIILGPVFISHVTQDEHELQRTLDSMTPEGVYEPASRILYEHVTAEKAVPVGRLYDPSGRSHTVLQEFAVRDLMPEHEERMVTELQRYLFAPHHIIQGLGEEFRRSIGHTLMTQESTHERTE